MSDEEKELERPKVVWLDLEIGDSHGGNCQICGGSGMVRDLKRSNYVLQACAKCVPDSKPTVAEI